MASKKPRFPDRWCVPSDVFRRICRRLRAGDAFPATFPREAGVSSVQESEVLSVTNADHARPAM
jgi:hypothetical protein